MENQHDERILAIPGGLPETVKPDLNSGSIGKHGPTVPQWFTSAVGKFETTVLNLRLSRKEKADMFTRKTVYGIDEQTARQIADDIERVLPFLPTCVDHDRTDRLQRFARDLSRIREIAGGEDE